MPEGPSIVILKEELMPFRGKKILEAEGNSKENIARLKNLKLLDIKSWGKHLILSFKDFHVRIHLLLFGTYRINERKENQARVSLKFKNGEVNFYACSVKITEGNENLVYDWEVDTMSDEWNAQKVFRSIKKKPEIMLCDLLLDQNTFAGSGNIIKNEVLFLTGHHPEKKAGDLTDKEIKTIVKTTRNYCFDFYHWKKKFELSKHWKVYKQKNCSICKRKITLRHLGQTKRRTFYCEHCQPRIVKPKKARL